MRLFALILILTFGVFVNSFQLNFGAKLFQVSYLKFPFPRRDRMTMKLMSDSGAFPSSSKAELTLPKSFKMVSNGAFDAIKVLWDFTRPHTIVGSAISVIFLFLYAIPEHLWFTKQFLDAISSAMIPSLLMNLYITGLNQVTDVNIDKINKPYLPIAAGRLSIELGSLIVVSSLLMSLYFSRSAIWPLKFTLLGSGILGTIYSLPPFRLKRFPLLAAFCILVVRGSLVNMGFFVQAKMQVLGLQIPDLVTACKAFPECVFLTAFFALFGVVIALMKDVPDVEGDKVNSIPSFSVELGAGKIFRQISALSLSAIPSLFSPLPHIYILVLSSKFSNMLI